jgi:hypothetical protein
MWLKMPRRSRPEDRFEAWIAQRHQERVLAGSAAVAGPCPDEAFLKSLATKSRHIQLSDPRVDHAASCPICMGRLMELQSKSFSNRRQLIFTAAVVSCLLVVAVFVVLARHTANTQSQMAETTAVPQTVDLWNAGTFRGDQPGQLQSVSLPAALVKVTIILPRYSEPGQYNVAVIRDQASRSLLAHASSTATGSGGREELLVYLDLRKVRRGSYFLSTTHEQNQASYYYPLEIR